MIKSEDKIGKYTLIEPLGQGAFGTVWLAERSTAIITIRVALKIPHASSVDIDEVRREAEVWVKASGHPNVLPIIEADLVEGHVILASEYAPQGSLADWLSSHGGRAPSPSIAVEITCAVLAGLAHLHSRGIIHRDLKPANILFQGEIPRIADFGISRALGTNYTGDASGTLPYMAPEALDGARDVTTDVWSVGVILFHLLCGQLPFSGESVGEIIQSIIGKEPVAPFFIPLLLEGIIQKALAKEPSDRYASAVEMRAALLSMPVSYELMWQPKLHLPEKLTKTLPLQPPQCRLDVDLLRRADPNEWAKGLPECLELNSPSHAAYLYESLDGGGLTQDEFDVICSVAQEWEHRNRAYCEIDRTLNGFRVIIHHYWSNPGALHQELFFAFASCELDRSLSYAPDPSVPHKSPIMSMNVASEPRRQHYDFAHGYLRTRCENDFSTQQFVEEIVGEAGLRSLYFRWMACAKTKPETDILIPPDGLQVDKTYAIHSEIGAIIRLPEPAGVAEAFYVCFVLPRGEKRWRYITLEMSLSAGFPCTVLGEWANGSHVRHGFGPVPEYAFFANEIEKLLVAA